MRKISIFPGSFDPFTCGHEVIVEEALRLFDRVIIAVGHNVNKQGLLGVNERKRLIDDIYKDDPRVDCQIYNTLTGEFALCVGAVAIVRGVRNTIDFEQERVLDAVNRRLYPELTTVVMYTPAEVAHISSSAVRELLAFGRDVSEFMPKGVDIKNYLKQQKQ